MCEVLRLVSMDGVADFLIRALATLVGALVAFGLAGWRQKDELRNAQAEKVETALFVLMLQREFLLNLHHQHLVPNQRSPVRAFQITIVLAEPALGAVDLRTLAFLLNVRQGGLLHHLTKAEAWYRSLLALLEARNADHRAFQEKLHEAEKAGDLPTDAPVSLEELKRAAGFVLANRLVKLTNDLYEMTDEALRFNRMTSELAEQAHKKLFPDRYLFRFEELPPDPPSRDNA